MNALLLVAHGSRREQSNTEVAVLANKLKSRINPHYDIVYASFLELAEPCISDGIDQCITDGAKTVIILPYFLNSGRHVTEDIPKIVHASQLKNPGIDIKIASHLGSAEQMLSLLAQSANNALNK